LNVLRGILSNKWISCDMAGGLIQALFQSRTRAALLRVLFEHGVTDSMSGLARRVRLSPNTVALEVRNLARAGLVRVESVGASDLVRANREHPAARPLLDLLRAAGSPAHPAHPATSDAEAEVSARVMESLAAYGAPLASFQPRKHFPLEETLLRGLRAARRESALLKVLPVVLVKNARAIDWAALKEGAKREKLRAELGMLVELTADVADEPELRERVRDLEDRRRKVTSFFNEPRSRFERELARSVTPPAARKWHFFLNIGEQTLRSTLRRHLG
jgi:DNA-binding Lrp family transcriptional regulator